MSDSSGASVDAQPDDVIGVVRRSVEQGDYLTARSLLAELSREGLGEAERLEYDALSDVLGVDKFAVFMFAVTLSGLVVITIGLFL